ncbi:MAG TPA: hypothetical protein VJ843_04135 [Candidatus Saccharimonadales bacterium]|nr:hypothetical protein [Candidatus Saccharimonadales bacterium]
MEAEFVKPDLYESGQVVEGQLELPEEASNEVGQDGFRGMIHSVASAANLAFVAAEISPLNEAARLGAFGAVQAVTENPLASSSAFMATTFAIEAAGAVATARLLNTERGSRIAERLQGGLKRLRLDKVLMGNIGTEAAVAMVAGSPTATLLKHTQDPSRTLEQDTRYGLVSSFGISAVTATEMYLGTKGVEAFENPQPLTVGAGLLAIAGLAGSIKWARDRLRLARMGGDYGEMVAKAQGPQVEGVDPSELTKAYKEKALHFIDVQVDGKKRKIPFAAPIKYASWINPEFFAERGYDTDALQYCVLPQNVLAEIGPEAVADALSKISVQHDNRPVDLLIDYPETVTPFYASSTKQLELDDLETRAESPAATYHYRAKMTAIPSESGNFIPDQHVESLSKEEIDAEFPRIWQIYQEQFQQLVDDHPIAGALKEAGLRQAIMAEGSRLAVYRDDEGKIMSFGYAVDDLSLCPWLNEAHFDDMNPEGLPYMYMPGIATSKEATTPLSTKIMNHILQETLSKRGDFILTFECSNLSARYIPKLVRRAVAQSGIANMSDLHELRHRYQIVRTKGAQ